METKRIYDAEGGVLREVICANAYDPFAITGFSVTQDCTAIVDQVAQMRHTVERGPGKNGRVLAEVPVAIIDQWFRDGSIHDQAFIKRWLNNGDNAAFRVDEKPV